MTQNEESHPLIAEKSYSGATEIFYFDPKEVEKIAEQALDKFDIGLNSEDCLRLVLEQEVGLTGYDAEYVAEQMDERLTEWGGIANNIYWWRKNPVF